MIEIRIKKRLPGFTLDVSLITEGGITVFFGKSGAGKTLTLRAIAGLLTPDSGVIRIGGRTVYDPEHGINLPARERRIGYVFQDYALFPYLTVEQNVAFGLRGLPPAPWREKVRQALALVQLEGLEDRYPRALSGGQQQRVGLARALATNPDLLLLDEPLSALDALTRSQIQGDLLLALRAFARPVVLVTHDIAEACTLGDRIAVFEQGRVIQVGGREEILRHPASRTVADLTGGRNLLDGRFLELRQRTLLLEWEGHTLEAPLLADFPRNLRRGTPLSFCIRPEHIMLLRDSAEGTASSEINRLRGVVVDETPRGITYTLVVRVAPPSAAAPSTPTHLEVEVSSQVYEVLELKGRKEWAMAIRPSAIHVFRPS